MVLSNGRNSQNRVIDMKNNNPKKVERIGGGKIRGVITEESIDVQEDSSTCLVAP
jgi:hypothetical protein